MAISEEQYIKLAQHIKDSCNSTEIQQILAGDFTALKALIVDELLLNDYRGTILDIIFEDLFTQKKKPFLKSQLNEFADFLISDLSLYYLKMHLARLVR